MSLNKFNSMERTHSLKMKNKFALDKDTTIEFGEFKKQIQLKES